MPAQLPIATPEERRQRTGASAFLRSKTTQNLPTELVGPEATPNTRRAQDPDWDAATKLDAPTQNNLTSLMSSRYTGEHQLNEVINSMGTVDELHTAINHPLKRVLCAVEYGPGSEARKKELVNEIVQAWTKRVIGIMTAALDDEFDLLYKRLPFETVEEYDEATLRYSVKPKPESS